MFIDDYRDDDVSPEALLARRGVPLEKDKITDPQALLVLAYGGSRDKAIAIQNANRLQSLLRT